MKLLRNQKGQGLTEYTVLMVLVVLVSVAAVKSIGSQLKIKLTSVSNQIRSKVKLDD